ncbi:malolactic enzyme [Lentilactobacillus otakiensis]|uniref:Malolactic enzyme n=1 Tax=Lentilactobacillus otakiensis DSM 19908 = JCM 15040 TaxID=1423780 RepID=S4NJ18_9LACO|nr:malolactic enzyme [Lentilactobacillus otakiensis]KRL10951.1 malic protein NAD-binding protein [Lentilactobacillus otakiensis DSM 19908 = JCM 15040]MBZ3777184.1 NAD-dependent malic enzyme [Lentilactobacillus otakiensis]MDV3517781.1 malolactic enzyme [Lentilactobacillus otakiensis]GAD17292.1 malate dehydrogenase [Lentilactobacillus otakiensis DSM 19908 = JCM 15040]
MTDSILNDPFKNKGTGFTEEEREQLGIVGMLPPKVQTIDEQANQVYQQYQSKSSALEKRFLLMSIFNENRTLFFKVFSQHVAEFMPIVYDPTIATTVEKYSEFFVQPQNAAFLSIENPESIEATLKNAAGDRDIRLLCVTDGEGILGIGDWGTQGVDITVGKLMVYTAAAGIDPSLVLPVVIDAGTNNEALLNNPLYLGLKEHRVRGDRYYTYIDQFVETVEKLFPDVYLHFEDFGRSNAANILNKYKDHQLVFNDDIQGTGIIVLAGIIGALNISKQKLIDQTYLCFGAGTAGAGITERIYNEMVAAGLSPEEARKHFYMVDKQGLLFTDTPGLTPEQKPFARLRSEFANADELTDLLAVVKAIHPTIMVGTSTQPGTFTEEVVKEMAAHTDRPIIFPISNPTKLIEAHAADLIKWTNGKGLVATGVPSDDVEYNGISYQIGQANNALIYPGLGMGAIASSASVLNDQMISAAAHSLGGIVDPDQPGAAVLPPVSKLSSFSDTVAAAVAQSAVDQKLNQKPIQSVSDVIQATKWEPKY